MTELYQYGIKVGNRILFRSKKCTQFSHAQYLAERELNTNRIIYKNGKVVMI